MAIRIHTSLFLTIGLKWLFSAKSYLLRFDGWMCLFIVFEYALIDDVDDEEEADEHRHGAIMM